MKKYDRLNNKFSTMVKTFCCLSVVCYLMSTASYVFAAEVLPKQDVQEVEEKSILENIQQMIQGKDDVLEQIEESTQRLPLGEVIEYKITQFKMGVGNAKLSFVGPVVKDGLDVFLIAFEADGPGFYDQEMIYVDPIHYRPVIVERKVDYLGKNELIVERYNQVEGRIEITKVAAGEETTQTIVKEGPIENIYGFIYRTRQEKNVELGQQVAINLPTMDIVMEVLKQHNYRIGGERRDSFYLNSTPSKYQLWLGADENLIPYKIKGSVGVGNTAMEFVDYRVVGEKLLEEFK